jgi:hypothetical protein
MQLTTGKKSKFIYNPKTAMLQTQAEIDGTAPKATYCNFGQYLTEAELNAFNSRVNPETVITKDC